MKRNAYNLADGPMSESAILEYVLTNDPKVSEKKAKRIRKFLTQRKH